MNLEPSFTSLADYVAANPPPPPPPLPEAVPQAVETLAPGKPPSKVTSTRRYGGKLMLAAKGPETARILFIATSAQTEELMEHTTSHTGFEVEPGFLKGPAGTLLVDLLCDVGIAREDYRYTALCRWEIPKTSRMKPKREHIDWGIPALMHDIETTKPDIIVCFGKPVFDLLCTRKLSQSDAEGAWFTCKQFPTTQLYLMPDIYLPVLKPAYVEAFRMHLLAVRDALRSVLGIERPRIVQVYRKVLNAAQLDAWLEEMRAGKYDEWAIDNEWRDKSHAHGRLRSIQICWKPGHSIWIKLRDDKGNYTFDVDEKEIGRRIDKVARELKVGFMGHFFSADAPWWTDHLGIDLYGRCIFDTAYAQLTVDESTPLGLETLALKYTDMGRYDLDLLLWRKDNPQPEDAGYEPVPDEILFPYGCADADCTFRAKQALEQELARQDLLEYYYAHRLPFVSDVYTNFALVGLPQDVEQLDRLRLAYSFCLEHLNRSFQLDMYSEAKDYLFCELAQLGHVSFAEECLRLVDEGDEEQAFQDLKEIVGQTHFVRLLPFFEHLVQCRVTKGAPLSNKIGFNSNAAPHMVRWLFHVKGFTPIKSTNRKEKGLPSIPWVKVLEMDPASRAQYSPAADKQTVRILADQHNDPMLKRLQEMKAVGNLVKSFLKPAETDPETGEVVSENGLHYWLSKSNRLHCQYSMTETGRPRTFNPNGLNLPKFVTPQIFRAIRKVILDLQDDGIPLPSFLQPFVGMSEKDYPSIRSCTKAPKGWCFVESDVDTAELVALAFMSGDPYFMSVVTEPDACFGLTLVGEDKVPVRLSYNPNIEIQADQRNPHFLNAYVKHTPWVKFHQDEVTARKLIADKMFENPELYASSDIGLATITKVPEKNLLRTQSGELRHPKHDLHWELAESTLRKPREILHKDKHRNGVGKVGNFSSWYGGSPNALERMIEASIGEAPEAGTGQAILDALARLYPVATQFMKDREANVHNPGYWRSPSGAVRHFATHGRFGVGADYRTAKSLFSSLSREARNFPMQNSVADTLSKACTTLLAEFRERGMQARPVVLLYDSIVTLCPLHERFEVERLHRRHICELASWKIEDRVLKYTISTDFVYRWSTDPSKQEADQLNDNSWMTAHYACEAGASGGF